MAHRVLLIEDDPPTRAHLGRAIGATTELDLVGSGASVAEGRDLLARETPEVLLTDLGLPDGNGIELIRELREKHPDALAMVVTVFGDERSVVSAIEAGASGYLLKDGSAEEIGGAVLELLGGGSPISPAIARHLLRRFQTPRAQPEPKPAPDPAPDAPTLSPRETEVLQLIAKGFSFPEIAELLEISAHTVTTHVRHIYGKLEVNSKSSAVYEAVSLGLISMD